MTESFRFAFCCVVLLCFVETIIQKRTRVTFYCVNLIEDFDIFLLSTVWARGIQTTALRPTAGHSVGYIGAQ